MLQCIYDVNNLVLFGDIHTYDKLDPKLYQRCDQGLYQIL